MAVAQNLPLPVGSFAPKMPLKLLGVMFAAFLTAFTLAPQQAEAGHKGRVAAGIVAGAIIAGALAHHHHKRHYYYNNHSYHGSGYYYHKPRYQARHYYRAPTYHHYSRPTPWTPAWYRYCSAKYRSFDAHSGTFQPYHGPRRLCR